MHRRPLLALLMFASRTDEPQLYWAGEPTDYRFIPEEKFQAVYAATEYGQVSAGLPLSICMWHSMAR